jgi:hypothetical protein
MDNMIYFYFCKQKQFKQINLTEYKKSLLGSLSQPQILLLDEDWNLFSQILKENKIETDLYEIAIGKETVSSDYNTNLKSKNNNHDEAKNKNIINNKFNFYPSVDSVIAMSKDSIYLNMNMISKREKNQKYSEELIEYESLKLFLVGTKCFILTQTKDMKKKIHSILEKNLSFTEMKFQFKRSSAKFNKTNTIDSKNNKIEFLCLDNFEGNKDVPKENDKNTQDNSKLFLDGIDIKISNFNCEKSEKSEKLNSTSVKNNFILPKRRQTLTRFDQFEMYSNLKSSVNLLQKLREISDESEDSETENIFNQEELNSLNYFKFEEFLYWLFHSSCEKIGEYSESLNQEGQELKETYLLLQENYGRKSFFSKMSILEENIHKLKSILKVKVEFFSSFIEKIKNPDKVIFKVISSFYNSKKLHRNLGIYLEQLLGKIRETKIVLNNLETLLNMIKKTFRIFLDDSQRKSDTKLNKLMMFLTISTGLMSTFYIIFQYNSMNVKLPIDKQVGTRPFYLLFLAAVIIFISQFTILSKWKISFK